MRNFCSFCTKEKLSKMATYNLKGILTLITGAGSGIGRATAQHFAESGAIVVVADINYEGAKETVQGLKNPADHLAIKVDVSDESSVNDLSNAILSRYNRSPTVVVHAAAILFANRTTIFDVKTDEWNRIMDINLKGTFFIDKLFAQKMLDEKIQNGSIINFASTAAKRAFPFVADYCASKAAIVSLTESFAQELAPHNIRVNAIGPHSTETPMLEQNSKEVLDEAKNMTPMKRFAKPDEMARMCLFLASTESSYITGQTIYVSGGV